MKHTAPYLEHVLGDTWCIVTDFCRIPLYMPDRSRAVMMDSGLKSDRAELFALLEREHIRISALLTTHIHLDHTGNHSAFKDRYGCTVYMTPYASLVSEDPGNPIFSLFETGILRDRFSLCKADEIIPAGADIIPVDGAHFRVLPLPGHAVEQIGLVTPDGVAYLSDALLSKHVVTALHLPCYTCCRQFIQTAETLRTLRFERCILAHNGVYGEIGSLIGQNIAALQNQLDLVVSFADSRTTLDRLCVAVMEHFGMDLDDLNRAVAAKRNIWVLVEYLVETGRLTTRVRQGLVEYRAAQ